MADDPASGALSGAAQGAAIGSVVPGIGTAVGAVVGGVAGLVSGFMGSKKKKQAERAAQAEVDRQRAFSEKLLNEAEQDRDLSEQLASGQLDFNNAKVQEIWQSATKYIEGKYGKLDELFAETYGPDGKIRSLVEADAAAQKAAMTGINSAIQSAAARGERDIIQALVAYNDTLKEEAPKLAKAIEEKAQGLDTAGTQMLDQAGKDYQAASGNLDKAAIASGNRLSDLQTKGPEGLAAGQAAVERGVSDIAREQERQAAARGVTVSAGEKLATGLARAEALGKTAVQAYDQYGNAINTAANTQANVAGAQGAMAGNRLATLLGNTQGQAQAVTGLQQQAYNTKTGAAGQRLANTTGAAQNILGMQTGAGNTVLGNLEQYGNKSLIGLETSAAQAQAGLISGRADATQGANTTLIQGQMGNQQQYVSGMNAAADQERMARAAGLGVASQASTQAQNLYSAQAAEGAKMENEAITGFGNSLNALANYYGKQSVPKGAPPGTASVSGPTASSAPTNDEINQQAAYWGK